MEATPKKPVWKKWWFWGLVVLFLIIVSAGSNGSQVTDDAPAETNSSQPTTIVDAPHLLSLTIDEAREELGSPDEKEFVDPTAEQLASGYTKTWSNQFTIDDYHIVLDFDVATREVTGFFIDTNDSSGATRNWKKLMEISNLSETDASYSVKPVEALKFPGQYTGVQATE